MPTWVMAILALERLSKSTPQPGEMQMAPIPISMWRQHLSFSDDHHELYPVGSHLNLRGTGCPFSKGGL
jgi:hypothetical protein